MVTTTNTTKTIAKAIVMVNKVFSMPRRALKTLPISWPVNPPKPTPLFCRTMLAIKASDVMIKAI